VLLRREASSPLQQTKHDVRGLASQRRIEGPQFILKLVTRWTYRVDSTPACMREILGSNSFPETDCFDLRIRGSPQSLQTNTGIGHHNSFLSCPSQFIIHWSSRAVWAAQGAVYKHKSVKKKEPYCDIYFARIYNDGAWNVCSSSPLLSYAFTSLCP
jgi:hypothetical protein